MIFKVGTAKLQPDQGESVIRQRESISTRVDPLVSEKGVLRLTRAKAYGKWTTVETMVNQQLVNSMIISKDDEPIGSTKDV